MKDGKIFRTQLSGFNKDYVNDYIRDIDQKHSYEIE